MMTPILQWSDFKMQLNLWSSYLFYAGLILFCLTLPFGVKLNNIAIFVILAGWLGESSLREKYEQLLKQRIVLLPIFYFLLLMLTIFYSDNLTFGKAVLETQIKLLLFPLIFASTTSINRDRLKVLLLVFSGWCITLSFMMLVVAALRYKENGNIDFFFYYELTDVIQLHPIYLANYLALAGLILIFHKGSLPGRLTLLFKVMMALYIIILIVMLSALSVILFIIFFTLVTLSKWAYSKFGLLKAAGVSIILIGSFVMLVMSMPYTRNKVVKSLNLHYEMDYPDSSWNSVTIRLAKWRCGLDVVQSHFFLGTGVGDEMDVLMKSYEKFKFLEGIRCNYNVHNQYLSTAMSGGVLLSIVLILMLVVGIRFSIRNDNLIAFAFLILMSFSLITENFFDVQKGVTFFSFFYPLLLSRKN